MSDDFDDFIDKIKKNFKIDSDIFDIDFLFIPESKNNLGIKPEKENMKGFKVSYHFESGMDKPEIKVEGNIDENRIRELLKGMDISKYPKLKNMFNAKSVNEYDANMLSLETQEHKENFEYLEPLVEINDYKDCSEIIFEIPGMSEEDIKIDINDGGDQLTIKAENKNRKYMKTIQLPFISSLKECDTEVKNGLAIILVKKLDK